MFYAWKTASDFSSGKTPAARAKSTSALAKKMVTDQNKRFFTALLLDGVWVDLTTYGPGNEDGREVSEERVIRYVRARRRALEATGAKEVNQSTPMPSIEHEAPEATPPAPEPTTEPIPEPVVQEGQRDQVVLAVDPTVVKALYEFLAMKPEQRELAINALTALSISADPFKSAVAVMLEESSDLVVEIAGPSSQEDSSEG